MTDLVDVNYRESSIYCDHLTKHVWEQNYIRTGQMSGGCQAASQ